MQERSRITEGSGHDWLHGEGVPGKTFGAAQPDLPGDDDLTADELDSSDAGTRPKNQAAVALGRLGGKKGGAARAARMTAEQRSNAARLAAKARWSARGEK